MPASCACNTAIMLAKQGTQRLHVPGAADAWKCNTVVLIQAQMCCSTAAFISEGFSGACLRRRISDIEPV